MENYEAFILDFSKLAKAISFYPENHPTLVNAMQKMAEIINFLAKDQALIVELNKDAFIIAGKAVPGAQSTVKDLAHVLAVRRVNKIIFRAGVESEELADFLNLLNMDAEHIFMAGGLEMMIDQSEVRNIGLSELQLKRKDEEKPEAPPEPQEARPVLEQVVQASAFVKMEEEKPLDTYEKWKKLRDRATLALNEKRVSDYLNALKEISEFLNALQWDREEKLVLDIFTTLIDHHKIQDAPAGIRKDIEKFVPERLNEIRVNLLLDIAILSYYSNQKLVDTIRTIFKFAADHVVETLFTRLGTANDIKTRRIIINEIAELGDVSLNRAVLHLKDERWYVVRNMVTILGILGRTEALPYLFDQSGHPDVRIRKEIIKTLARIRDPRAIAKLRERLYKEDDDVKRLIVFSLGIMKDAGSIDTIHEILEGNSDLLLQKEAMIALGRIGGNTVFPVLKDYALKKGFFNRADAKVLRLAAINGLAEMPGPDSKSVLEKLMKDGDPDIKNLAFEALQRIKHT